MKNKLIPKEQNELNFFMDLLIASWTKTPNNAIEHMEDRLKTNPSKNIKCIVEALLTVTNEEVMHQELKFFIDSCTDFLQSTSKIMKNGKDDAKINPSKNIKRALQAHLEILSEETLHVQAKMMQFGIENLIRMRDKLLAEQDEYKVLAGQALLNAMESMFSSRLQR